MNDRVAELDVAQPVVGREPEQLLERDPHLEAGQRRAEAEVRAVAEREVRLGLSHHVELVGALPPARVAVGGGAEGVDVVAGRELGARELGVVLDPAGTPLHRPEPAHALLDRRGHQRRVVGHQRALLRVLLERDEAVRHRLRRRVVARDEQEDAGGADLAVAHRVVAVEVEHRGDEIVGPVAPVPLDLLLHVVVELARRLRQHRAPLLVLEAVRQVRHDRVRPVHEVLVPLRRDAEHLRHDDRRHLGEVGDEVEAVVARDERAPASRRRPR